MCRHRHVPVLALLLAWLAGCATTEQKTELARRVGRSDLSVAALRTRVRDMARRFSGLLEVSADDIAAKAGTPSVRDAMTTFKLNAIPAMQGALLQPDPVAALVDAWALLAQLQIALPERAERAGATPEVMTEASRLLREQEGEVEALWRELSGRQDVSHARARVYAWAKDHPLIGPLVARQSTVPLLADLTDQSNLGALRRAASLTEDVRDITTRVDLYAASLPRQARWQVESMTQEALRALPAREAMEELRHAVAALDAVGALASTTPAMLARERQAVLTALDAEREALQRFVESERRALTETLRGERQVVLATLRTERIEALQQTEHMGHGLVDHAFDRLTTLVDRVLLGVLALGVLGVAGAIAIAALVLRGWRGG
ncbi:chemotaxis protein [Myxococcus sp. K15C18031901]|uniref:chemotaxis protein n=1 Tax=Myxococcus dinghuensis TaxID=2906761 RepID=UPI0020A6E89A|nr:chemotaxis protein [Myxococcus dinghuensis]MCP3097563.1 chemotaxis protein [Myxococcus dinghuensis]